MREGAIARSGNGPTRLIVILSTLIERMAVAMLFRIKCSRLRAAAAHAERNFSEVALAHRSLVPIFRGVDASRNFDITTTFLCRKDWSSIY